AQHALRRPDPRAAPALPRLRQRPRPRHARLRLLGRERAARAFRPRRRPRLDRLRPTGIVAWPVTLPASWVASTKPEAVIARRECEQPFQGRGRTLAPRDRGPGAWLTLPVTSLLSGGAGVSEQPRPAAVAGRVRARGRRAAER